MSRLAALLKEGVMPWEGDDEGKQKAVENALKNALKEWLDDKFAELGKWSVRVIVVAALGALMIFIMKMGGWQR